MCPPTSRRGQAQEACHARRGTNSPSRAVAPRIQSLIDQRGADDHGATNLRDGRGRYGRVGCCTDDARWSAVAAAVGMEADRTPCTRADPSENLMKIYLDQLPSRLTSEQGQWSFVTSTIDRVVMSSSY